VDRDSDGCITADDLFAAQAQVMQKNEAFVKVLFVFLMLGLSGVKW
jgi:hypothetical protein